AVDQTLEIAAEHFEPGQHVMPEGHRLRGLQMGEARHDRVGFALCQAQQAFLQTGDLGQDQIDLVTQPQPNVGRDLVVAAATGVQLLAGDTDA
nr:hypothetical protein [Tanacetum cinerariifolium]